MARRLLDFGVRSAIVTLDRDGMAWADAGGAARLFPARPRQVCDITGAGDMVLATLGYMFACGADAGEAIEVANVAGGLEVERLGVVPLDAPRNPRGTLARLRRRPLQDPRRRRARRRVAAAARPAGGS